jgi:Putative outer membrane beta-barrel porin, MtrB/PioB
MKKTILIIAFLMLWASLAVAQQAAGTNTAETQVTGGLESFEGKFSLGYRSINQSGNTIAGEYEYLKSSAIGALDLEWDPLPHRFVLESYYLNNKDYFAEADYAFKDIVVINGYTRGLFHNLNHYILGPDDPTTPSPSFTDRDPGALYSVENQLRRAFIRFKTPDFPFHLYADVWTIDREGTIQQRFLRGFSGGLDIVSQSRNIDWNTQEIRVGANSHLGPIEVDYSHMEKKFEALTDKVLFDTTAIPGSSPVPHNLTPNLESSSDTVKIHTTYSGRMVAAGTYTSGDKKNEDSGAKVQYWNAGGDLTYLPITSVMFVFKYRHYDLDVTNPNTVISVTPTALVTVNVRDSIASSRDVLSGTLRYRATDRLTLKGEYVADTTDRTRGTLGANLPAPPSNAPAFWNVPENTTKGTAKIGLAYRVMNKLNFRADYSYMNVDNPAYDTDPNKSQSARASLTWLPTTWINTLLSYSTVHEKRDELDAPLAGGSRDATRDQGLASATFVIGSRSSITASYAYFRNKVDQTVTFQDGVGAFSLESGVPYADIAHVGSLALTYAPIDRMNLTASASRSYSRGNFTLAGTGSVTNVGGIPELSSIKVVDDVYAAGIEMQLSRNVSSEIQYQYRNYDDQLDNSQDGKVHTLLATLSMKW